MTNPSSPAWREQLAGLRFLAVKVAQVHGPSHPDAAILAEVVNTLSATTEADRAGQIALGHRIAILTDQFRPWPGSCGTVARLYAGLQTVVSSLPRA